MQATVPAPLDLTDLCAQYLLAQFRSELGQRSSQPLIGVARAPNTLVLALRLQLSVPLILELDSVAKILADAFKNPGE